MVSPQPVMQVLTLSVLAVRVVSMG